MWKNNSAFAGASIHQDQYMHYKVRTNQVGENELSWPASFSPIYVLQVVLKNMVNRFLHLILCRTFCIRKRRSCLHQMKPSDQMSLSNKQNQWCQTIFATFLCSSVINAILMPCTCCQLISEPKLHCICKLYDLYSATFYKYAYIIIYWKPL